jgi:hypothetical protein
MKSGAPEGLAVPAPLQIQSETCGILQNCNKVILGKNYRQTINILNSGIYNLKLESAIISQKLLQQNSSLNNFNFI